MLCIICASAHPGHTDAAGGHWDSSTGEYHYHHGYPAHQHENGICPYEQPEVQELETDDEYEYDYGPEAETDFDSKREAWANGYASAIEYSSDSTYSSSAYSQGYDEGYDEATSKASPKAGKADRTKAARMVMMRDTATATPRVIPHLITTSSTEARSTRPANRSRSTEKSKQRRNSPCRNGK